MTQKQWDKMAQRKLLRCLAWNERIPAVFWFYLVLGKRAGFYRGGQGKQGFCLRYLKLFFRRKCRKGLASGGRAGKAPSSRKGAR